MCLLSIHSRRWTSLAPGGRGQRDSILLFFLARQRSPRTCIIPGLVFSSCRRMICFAPGPSGPIRTPVAGDGSSVPGPGSGQQPLVTLRASTRCYLVCSTRYVSHIISMCNTYGVPHIHYQLQACRERGSVTSRQAWAWHDYSDRPKNRRRGRQRESFPSACHYSPRSPVITCSGRRDYYSYIYGGWTGRLHG